MEYFTPLCNISVYTDSSSRRKGRTPDELAQLRMEGSGMKSRSDGHLAQADRPGTQAKHVVGIL